MQRGENCCDLTNGLEQSPQLRDAVFRIPVYACLGDASVYRLRQ